MDSDSTRERRESLIVFALIWLGCAGWSGSMTYGRPARPLEPIPARPAVNHVLDLAEVVEAAAEVQLEEAARKTGVLVVSIPSISAYRDPSIESLASRWHQAWLLGDSQVLLLLSPTDRKARIELGSVNAAAKTRTDLVMSKVIVPACIKGDYAAALLEGTRQLGDLPSRSDAETPSTWRNTLLGLAAICVLAGLFFRMGATSRVAVLGLGAALVAWLYLDPSYYRPLLFLWSAALGLACLAPGQSEGDVSGGALVSLLVLVGTLPFEVFKAAGSWGVGGLFLGLLVLPVYLALKFIVRGLSGGGWGSGDYSSSDGSSSSDSTSSGWDYSSSYDSGASSSSYDSGGGGSSDSGSTGSW